MEVDVMMKFGEESAEMSEKLTSLELQSRLMSELYLLQKIEKLVRQRRVMEPNHSRHEHECPECEILTDLDVLRQTWSRRRESVSEPTKVLNSKDLADLPVGTVIIVENREGGSFPYVVERVMAKGENEDLGQFGKKEDARLFVEAIEKRQSIPAKAEEVKVEAQTINSKKGD